MSDEYARDVWDRSLGATGGVNRTIAILYERTRRLTMWKRREPAPSPARASGP